MDTLQELVASRKTNLKSWCNCATVKTGDDLARTDKIIVELTKELVVLERYLDLQKVSRGLSVEIVKQLVDQHYESVLGIDAVGNFIDTKEK